MKNFPESMRPIPKPPVAVKSDQDYYNDLPGKTPPELSNTKTSKSPKPEKIRERISSNLIDLDTPMDHNYVNEKKEEESDDELFGEIASSKLNFDE